MLFGLDEEIKRMYNESIIIKLNFFILLGPNCRNQVKAVKKNPIINSLISQYLDVK